MKDDFDWRSAPLAIRAQAEIAIYSDDAGDCVIRQCGHLFQDDDQVVIVTRANVLSLIAALEEWMKVV
jgi:hypothetical protein